MSNILSRTSLCSLRRGGHFFDIKVPQNKNSVVFADCSASIEEQEKVWQESEEGILRRRTFELMDGKLSLDEIAHRLAAEFPQRFSSPQEALSYAGVLSQEYSR